ncbi:rRNA maturation RNase YbeY [Yeosuana sp. MJ-SS3]|uniref:Endoribonuclease YbeY n=1 Tax=Gilvirhabdus luticola TaxID=3079858 RepID=A0ABU3U2V9_9FLAO|nr:rRNA maturation RNase YbeY [Yeosuana sp. MJ-SS3]MDU8884681.1 rRNA maturation RNase YbeY [Yeosuana sp. MJ-SS3]
MIQFNFETQFTLQNSEKINQWISSAIIAENKVEGDISYIFCDDDYLHKINLEFLGHNSLTDIISFDYTVGKIIHGDIYISVERVKENAQIFKNNFDDELCRVIIHGILHYCGYRDKSNRERTEMRAKENAYLKKLKSIM